ncbi:exodeoxyribonuclease III [Oceanispirochaeta crateris]|uniref:Exodeoxyribonuclease III n=1 Tax=Oceanispirochaeta crateris TaxID=2518645 RepID=A0A5C1QKJ2_9SPIO|nr:exodeoxyribonuclease III [Oceanispirochaeta crateris]QEN07114.1 exodeoxyribonuclease III [Oceanispirochaeta crateris]
MTKIVSWNVNGIRAVEGKGLFEWMDDFQPDILCLQETKAQPEQLKPHFMNRDGYSSFFISAEKKGYSGTALYTKVQPRSVTPLGIEEFDVEGRTLIAEYQDFTLINCYFPNSQSEGKRLDYKIRFNQAIKSKLDTLVSEGKNIVICGDLNVAHKPIDLTHPKNNEKNPGYLPEERAWMDDFTENGYTDTFRVFHKEPEQYSWWSYRMKARERNVGWRLDYFCVNDSFLPRVKDSLIHQEVMGSDHCPIELILD